MKKGIGFLAGAVAVFCLIGVMRPVPCLHAAESLIERIDRPYTGDLPQLQKIRRIRVLVTYSKTNYFFDRGRARGFEYEMIKSYEAFLNREVQRTRDWTRVIFVPVPFNQLLTALKEGRGDIAAAGLTVTGARAAAVRFTAPYMTDVSEVVVAHGSRRDLAALTDLAGKRISVKAGSSYAGHLEALNKRLTAEGLAQIRIWEGPAHLATEDFLELANAGTFPLTVADNYIAAAWARVLPDIRVLDTLAIHTGGRIAWAVRTDSPALLASLNAFIEKHRSGTLLGNIFFRRYYENTQWIKDAGSAQEMEKLAPLTALFQEYGQRYGFDFLALAALAYQESKLNNALVSPSGAVGIMQVRPSTAADRNIGIPHIEQLENNIHAGSKYLAFLRDRYFSDPAIAPQDRVFFSWAAYNAGPAKINALRAAAKERGFDGNQWFFNTEVLAAEVIGRETVNYVTNIAKYYIAYRLEFDLQQQRLKEKRALQAGG